MKHYFKSLFIASLLIVPLFASAITVPWERPASGRIHPQQVNDDVLIGRTASTTNSKLEVNGTTTAANFTATSTTATSSLQKTSITGAVSILGEYFTNFTTYVRSLFSASSPLSYDPNTGIFTCPTCTSGGGSGSDVNWTFFNGSGVRVSTTTNQALVGGTATTSLANLEIQFQTAAKGSLLTTGSTTLQNFTFVNATGTQATTSNLYSTKIGTNSEYFTDLTGNGLNNSAGLLTCNTASGSVFGCLASADWTIFNNKISSSSLSATLPITYNSSTGALSTAGGTFGTGDYVFPANLTVTSQGTLANLLVTSSSTLQNWTGLNSTSTNATTTTLFSTTASTTNLYLATGPCTTSNALNVVAGKVTCGAISGIASSTLLADNNTFSGLNSFTNLITLSTTLHTGSTTLQNFTGVNSTTSQATTTALAVTGRASQLLVTNSNGSVVPYSAQTCTNQFARSWTAAGVVTCATVGAADVSLANLSATDNTLTFSGTYNGATARTIGVNLTNPNTWTGLQQFSAGASTTQLSVYTMAYFGATATTTINGTGDLMVVGSTTLQNFTARNATTSQATTTYLAITGITGSTQCLQVNTNGTVSGTGVACGSGGGGSSGGTWSTTTSTVAGTLINYPNNATDVVAIGSNASTSAEFWFDPNTVQASFGTGSTNIHFEGTAPSYFTNNLGIGTTTARWALQLASSTKSQLTLSDASLTSDHWSFRNAGGVFYIATSSPSTFATSSISTFSIDGNGQLTLANNLLVNGSTTLQNFTAINSTTSKATTTSFAISSIATGNCLQTTTGGAVVGTGSACGAGGGSGGNSKFATSTNSFLSINPNGGNNVGVGIGTSTPAWALQVSSSTRPQLALSDASLTSNIWTQRNAGGWLYFATASPSTFATSSVSALTVNPNGYLGIGSTTPSSALSIVGDIYQKGRYVKLGNAESLNPMPGTGMELWGDDNTTNGVQIGVGNRNSGTSAYNGIFLNNNLTDSTVTHYGGLFQNSSAYTDTTFGTGASLKNQVQLWNTDGKLSFISSTSTTALNPAGINFLVGGVTSGAANVGGNEVFNLNLGGFAGFGTTTPRWLLQLATSTRPQLALSDSSLTSNIWTMRNSGGNLYFATASPSTFATSTYTALTIDNNGFMGFGTTSPQKLFHFFGSQSGGPLLIERTLGATGFAGTQGIQSTFQGVNIGSADAGPTQTFSVLDGTKAGVTGNNIGDFGFVTNTTTGTTSGRAMIRAYNNGVAPTLTGGFLTIDGAIGSAGFSTSTPRWALQIASSTAPQLALSDGSLTSNHWTFRNTGGTLYFATSSPTTFATSTIAAFTINATGNPSLTIGSTTPTITMNNGTLVMGSNGANGTTTIGMGKIQFDGYNSAGSRTCAYIAGTTWVVVNAACTQ